MVNPLALDKRKSNITVWLHVVCPVLHQSCLFDRTKQYVTQNFIHVLNVFLVFNLSLQMLHKCFSGNSDEQRTDFLAANKTTIPYDL